MLKKIIFSEIGFTVNNPNLSNSFHGNFYNSIQARIRRSQKNEPVGAAHESTLSSYTDPYLDRSVGNFD